jgi:hypothetical protein
VVHGHFEDGYLGIGGHAQDGEWKAYVIVEISDGLRYWDASLRLVGDKPEACPTHSKHGRDDVFGGSFSGAASHAHHLTAPLFARPGSNFLERGQRVGNGENVSGVFAIRNCRYRAFSERFVQVGIPIVIWSSQCKE